MKIRSAIDDDFESIWPIFHAIVAAGDVYSYPIDITKKQAFQGWMRNSGTLFVCEEGGDILGTYYLKTNKEGPGEHVCNCGYMVAANARERGVATQMCLHSQEMAIDAGYKAMQFNFVAATNIGAIRLWHKLGYETVGRLPKAFNHPKQGYVDALVMYKWLVKSS